MTFLLVSWQHPLAGTFRSRRRADFALLRTLSLRHRPTLTSAVARGSGGQFAIIGGFHILANSQSLSPADTATPTNPHRRPSAHRLPAGSFFGGFRTPARRPYTGSTARARPPSETLPESGSSN